MNAVIAFLTTRITSVLALMLLCVPNIVQASCIGVIPPRMDNFFRLVIAGAKEAGNDLGVTVLYRSPVHAASPESQQEIVNTFLEKGCDAFVIAPTGKLSDQTVEKLVKQNIPVVYMDRNTKSDHLAKSIVMTNNFQAGVQAAKYMLNYMDNRKTSHKVGMLRLSKGTPSTDEREEGFSKTMKEHGIDISFDAYLGLTYGGAARSAHQFRKQLQNEDALFTPNESTTLGLLHELSDLAADQRPLHIGFDLTPVIADAIREGKMAGVIVQQPQRMGHLAVQAVVEARAGKTVKEYTFTDIAFVTKENLADFEKIYFKVRE